MTNFGFLISFRSIRNDERLQRTRCRHSERSEETKICRVLNKIIIFNSLFSIKKMVPLRFKKFTYDI